METVTLVIAVVAVALSMFSLGWQVMSHVLTGSRAHAKAVIGKVNRGGYASWPLDGDIRLDDKQTTMPGEWYLGVTVHNRGRVPVDVIGYQLRLASGPAYGENAGALAPSSAVFNPPRPATLGPGQQATWTLELTGVSGFLELLGPKAHVPSRGGLFFPRSAGIHARMVVDLGTGKTVRSGRFRLDALAPTAVAAA